MAWINKNLSLGFYCLGDIIARYPRYFIVTFTILAFALSTGIEQFKYENDLEYLFTVSNGDSKHERDKIDKYFPPNNKNRFDPSRVTRVGRFARIIITEKNEENLLREDIWKEIANFDEEMHKISIEWKNATYNYGNLCAKWFEDCFENEYLEIADLIPDVENGKARISYPVFFNPRTFKTHVLPQYFGGVNLTEDGFSLESVKAIVLTYVLAIDNKEDNARGELWENAVLRTIEARKSLSNSTLKIFQFAYKTYTEENEKNVLSCIIPLVFSTLLTSVYVVLSCSSSDWVKSKPFVGLMGLISGVLGTSSAFGALCYLQVPLIGINIAIPFLLLGIGIDDTFVMLSAWRMTSPHDSVPKRMSECFSESAVSVTITTFSDMFSFFVGVFFTPIHAIQIFSAYAATGVLCIYIWQIFFFGPMLAISGYIEAENRHSIFWWMKATPKSKSESMSSLHRFFLTGGIDEHDPYNPKNEAENSTMVFFRDKFAPFVCKPTVKLAVLVFFVAYWTISYYGITQLQEGLEERRMGRYDSYMNEYFLKDREYFKVFPYRVQIAVTTPLDYSLKSTQDKIGKMLDKFTSHPKLSEEFNENWLRSYTTYLENYKEFIDYNVTSEASFIKVLREDYLKETSPISQDVVFSDDGTRIIASRFILQAKHLWDPETSKNAVMDLRKMAEEMLEEGLEVTVYNPWFNFADQFIIIRELTIKLLIITIFIVMVVCALLIPSFLCCVCVLFSIFSIEIGVVGFMSLWGVNLDLISVICIVMCIGFSVDFSAHISYSYIISKAESPEERVKDSLYSLGLPILQASVSTTLAILSLNFVPSYIFQSDFKIVFLVIIFATLHSLFLLPVLFTILTPKNILCLPWKTKETYSVSNVDTPANYHLNYTDQYFEKYKAAVP